MDEELKNHVNWAIGALEQYAHWKRLSYPTDPVWLGKRIVADEQRKAKLVTQLRELADRIEGEPA